MTVGIKDNKRTTSRFLHKRGHVTDAQPPPTRVNDGWSTGDTRVMYVWDAHTETQLLDLWTRELGEAGDDAACQRRTAQHVVPLVRSAFICGERSGQHHVRCHA